MNLTKKNNELKWEHFKKTLEVKNPIYADVKIVAFENDTVYHNLKATYATKVRIRGAVLSIPIGSPGHSIT